MSALVGLMLGVVLTLSVVMLSGGWYEYRTMTADLCQAMPMQAEVVPNQPNPCNFRRPRWHVP